MTEGVVILNENGNWIRSWIPTKKRFHFRDEPDLRIAVEERERVKAYGAFRSLVAYKDISVGCAPCKRAAVWHDKKSIGAIRKNTMHAKLDQILAQGFGIWEFIGVMGWMAFTSRFVLQWIASELRKESVIPVSFWYLSIIGSLLLLAYSWHIADPIFILSYVFNSAIYLRNLFFIRSKKRQEQVED